MNVKAAIFLVENVEIVPPPEYMLCSKSSLNSLALILAVSCLQADSR